MKTLVSFFEERVKKFSKRPALKMRPRFRTIHWNFGELDNYASGIAYFLEQNGVKFGDRVILIAHNSPYWVGTFFGILLRGGIVVPLNPQSTKNFVEKIIKETEAKILFKNSCLFSHKSFGIRTVDIDFKKEQAYKKHHFSKVDVSEDNIAEIVYTSGTTGDPKGVVLTHKNIISNVEAITKIFKASCYDRTVSILPLFHMYEQTCSLFFALKYGMEIMYAPNISSRAVQQCLQEQRATKMLVVPEFLETLIRKIESRAAEVGKKENLQKMFWLAECLPFFLRRLLFRKVHKMLGGRLRHIFSGGAFLAPDIERKWSAMGFIVLQGYGLTETSPVVTSNLEKKKKKGSVGCLIPGVKVTISKDKEILIEGPGVFKGYYHDETKTRETFDAAGRFKTGDMGHFDEYGFLYISGRKKYVIVSPSGENVYPEDVEIELKNIEGVLDAVVVGYPLNGREIVYAVLLTDRNDIDAIVHQVNYRLAPYQRIQSWDVWPEGDFPRSATRKVKKEEVIKWLKDKKQVKAKGVLSKEMSPLVRLLNAVSGKDVGIIRDKSNLFSDLHFDSLMRIELVSRIEEVFDVVVEEHLITQKTTVKDLEELIKKGLKGRPPCKFKSWLLSPISNFFRFLIQRLIFPFWSIFFKVKSEGLENIRDFKLPAIFMTNHLSYLDTLLILKALPLKIRNRIAVAAAVDVLYKKYWFIANVLEFICNSYSFPRKEDEDIKPGLERTGRILDRNFSILVFPEGKISFTGELLPLKRGAGFLAVEMDVPVVPIIIKGIRNLISEYKVIPHSKGRVIVCFGKPFRLSPGITYDQATEEIYTVMKRLSQ